MDDRRALFGEYIRRFNPTGDPAVALREGFYVPSPEGTSARLASRFAIDSASAHLVVGGIGSGKTTDLLALKALLDDLGGTVGLFVDVPAVQKASTLTGGVLVAHAWSEISRFIEAQGWPTAGSSDELAKIDSIVHGRWIDKSDGYPDEGDDSHYVSGLIHPPSRNPDLEELEKALADRIAVVNAQFVLLFDGLDRVRLKPELANMILRDTTALAKAGVGSVTVGPQGLRHEVYRRIAERFTSFQLQGADASLDAGRGFLERVLRARAKEDILPPESCARLVDWSGGLVRDLISLARDAGQAAYERGASRIDPSHVDSAADRFGRTLLLGVTTPMASRLLELRPQGSQGTVDFTATNDVDLELLALRLIVEVPGAFVRHILHPTIKPLLGGMRRKTA